MNWSNGWSTNPNPNFEASVKEQDSKINLCEICKQPQFETPSGLTCSNGHGGAMTIEAPSSANPWDAMDRDQLLMEHKKLQDELAALKEKEMELRKYIVKRAFPNAIEGTNTEELGNGYQLKAVVKYNYKLSDNDIVEKTLAEIAATGNEGGFIADRLVGWTPNFYKTEYNKLVDDAAAGNETAKKILKLCEKMLTITEAAPTLEVKEPKAKKK